MTIGQKIAAHMFVGRVFTDNEWNSIKILDRDLRFKRGEIIRINNVDMVFVSYNKSAMNGIYVVTEQSFDAMQLRLTKKNKEFHAKNPNRLKIYYKRKYNKLKSNPVMLMQKRMRSRLRKVVKAKLLYGRAKDKETAEFLIWLGNYMKINYLNGKEYHIDHIKPVHMFDLCDREGQLTLNSPYNVRWLGFRENIIKQDRVPTQKEIDDHAVLVHRWKQESKVENRVI